MSETSYYRSGTRVRKCFRQGWFDGEITSIDMDNRSYDITYSDGDAEDVLFEDPEIELLVHQASHPTTS